MDYFIFFEQAAIHLRSFAAKLVTIGNIDVTFWNANLPQMSFENYNIVFSATVRQNHDSHGFLRWRARIQSDLVWQDVKTFPPAQRAFQDIFILPAVRFAASAIPPQHDAVLLDTTKPPRRHF